MTTKLSQLSKAMFMGSVITSGIILSGCQEQPQKLTAKTNQNTKKNAVSSPLATVEISNPSTFVRSDEPIYISYADLGLDVAKPIQIKTAQKTLATQAVDIDTDGQMDGIYFVVDLASAATVNLVIDELIAAPKSTQTKRVQADLAHKVNGQWQPHSRPPKHQINAGKKEYVGGEFKNVQTLTPPDYYTDHSNWIRYEGPGIESDKVGYRFYLDWRNGFDIFGKLTPEPVLHNVGLDGYSSYHDMQYWGMDILKVGGSLGAGGFGVMDNNNELEHVTDVAKRTATIKANGDLRATVQINYQDWQNSRNTQDLTANISMHAGSELAHVELSLTQDLPNFVAGLVKHDDTQFIEGDLSNLSNYGYSYIASWGNQSLDKSPLGMAIFFKKGDLIEIRQDDKNYLAILKPKGRKNEQKVNYYFASIWQPQSGINDKAAFTQYLEQQAEKLTLTPRVRIKTRFTNKQLDGELTAEKALKWTKALADSELDRKALGYEYTGWDVNRKRKPKFEYDIIGVQPYAFAQLGQLTNESKYNDVVDVVVSSFISPEGEIKRYKKSNFNIDNIPPGRNLIDLYQRTDEKKYLTAINALREQLKDQPRTSNGAFWHKKKYQGQVWLDGVYMGMPFLAKYGVQFEQGHQQQETLDEVVNEFKLTREFLKDESTGLYYHGWDELKKQSWADTNTGLSQQFWARGMGWLAMAVVDVLDYIPEQNTEQREFLLGMVEEVAQSLAKVQDSDTGTWWQVMDKPHQVGNYRESSASAMFVYFYAKALNQGYLSDDYLTVTKNAYNGLLNEFILVHPDSSVSMLNQCYVAGLGFGRDGSYRYYMSEPIVRNDPKGNSPFILAGVEMVKLLTTTEQH